jgi:hypothetical protein
MARLEIGQVSGLVRSPTRAPPADSTFTGEQGEPGESGMMGAIKSPESVVQCTFSPIDAEFNMDFL